MGFFERIFYQPKPQAQPETVQVDTEPTSPRHNPYLGMDLAQIEELRRNRELNGLEDNLAKAIERIENDSSLTDEEREQRIHQLENDHDAQMRVAEERHQRLDDQRLERQQAATERAAEDQETRGREADQQMFDDAYARAIILECQKGNPEVTQEQREFILENLAKRGHDSVYAQEMFKSQGFLNLKDAASQLNVKVHKDENGELSLEAKSRIERLPAFVKESLADAAKSGVIGLGVAGILTLATGGALMPALIGVAGGTAGSTIARALTRVFHRDKAFRAKEGEKTLAYSAMEEMLSNIQAAQNQAKRYIEGLNNPENLNNPERLGNFRKATLNKIVESINNNTLDRRGGLLANNAAFRAHMKKSELYQTLAGIGGGFAGALGASAAYNYASAHANGVRLVTTDGHGHAVQWQPGQDNSKLVMEIAKNGNEGHMAKLIDGSWHYMVDRGDLAQVVGKLGSDAAGNFHVISQGASALPGVDVFHHTNSAVFNQINNASAEWFHAGQLANSPTWAILKESVREALARSALLAGAMGVGNSLWNRGDGSSRAVSDTAMQDEAGAFFRGMKDSSPVRPDSPAGGDRPSSAAISVDPL